MFPARRLESRNIRAPIKRRSARLQDGHRIKQTFDPNPITTPGRSEPPGIMQIPARFSRLFPDDTTVNAAAQSHGKWDEAEEEGEDY